MQARNCETICIGGGGVKKGIFRCLKGVASKKFFRTSDSFQRPLKKGELSNIRFDFIQNFILPILLPPVHSLVQPDFAPKDSILVTPVRQRQRLLTTFNIIHPKLKLLRRP